MPIALRSVTLPDFGSSPEQPRVPAATYEARCRAAVEAILHKYVRYQRIVLVLTLPDPPPDLMRVVVAAIREVAQELAQIGHADRAVAHRLGTLVSRRLGAPEGWFEGGIARQETQE